MAETYSVVLAGSVRETQTLDAVKPRLAALFKVDTARVQALFGRGPTVLRRGLDDVSARKWVALIEQTGALCWIEPDEEAAAQQPEQRPAVTQQPIVNSKIENPPAPPPNPVKSDASAPSRLMQELARADAREPQINAQPAWADNQPSQTENPADGPVPPADETIQPIAAAVSETPPVTGTKRSEMPRFVKCPKCGHIAESIDDWLMTRAECPECGLLAEKFVKTYMTQPLRDPATIRPDSVQAAAGTSEIPAANGKREDSEQHWLTFWTSPYWLEFFVGSLFLSLVCASLPPILYLAEAYTVESQRLSALNLAATGLLVWAVALIGGIACFYCYSVWKHDRRIFLIHVVASLGVCAVLAVLGGVLSRSFAFVFHLTDRLRLEAALTPARMLASPVLLFVALILYLGFIRLPAEKNLVLYIDGPEYAAKVQDARSVAGADFPAGHKSAYDYYRYVYVETSKGASPSFDKVLRRLVPDHYPASFNLRHSPDATLMVMNAIGFRDDLARQGLVSDKTHVRLSDLALLWGQTGHWKGVAEDPVRRFDAQCPINRGELRSLEKKANQRLAANGRL